MINEQVFDQTVMTPREEMAAFVKGITFDIAGHRRKVGKIYCKNIFGVDVYDVHNEQGKLIGNGTVMGLYYLLQSGKARKC